MFVISFTVPFEGCTETVGSDPQPHIRHLYAVVTAVLSVAIGVAAANRRRAYRRRESETVSRLLELWTFLVLAFGAAAVCLYYDVHHSWAIVSVFGLGFAVWSFLRTREEMRNEGDDARDNGPMLPILLGTTGLFVYPSIAFFVLYISSNPVCVNGG